MIPELLVATRNRKKLRELHRILANSVEITLRSLDDVPPYAELPETGATFAENALIKAREGARRTGMATVADDSGLTVEALNGMPGVLSARWAGRHGDDEANVRLLLGQLEDVPLERRGAAFVCAAALVLPDGTEKVVEGRMLGRIVDQPRGTHGFGYDPIFVPASIAQTSAELSDEDKDAISHRGHALRKLAPIVAEMYSST